VIAGTTPVLVHNTCGGEYQPRHASDDIRKTPDEYVGKHRKIQYCGSPGAVDKVQQQAGVLQGAYDTDKMAEQLSGWFGRAGSVLGPYGEMVGKAIGYGIGSTVGAVLKRRG
jgi:hypothetical protein